MVSTFTGPAVYTDQIVPEDRFHDIGKGKAKFNTKADNGWMAMVQYVLSPPVPAEKLPREFYVRKLTAASIRRLPPA